MSKVLIVGAGGREHAIGWKLKQSPKVGELFFASGNGGTSLLGTNLEFEIDENRKIVKWAKENKIDLVVVSPDPALANGLVDDLEKVDIKAFGPKRIAAQIESSKDFAKQLMVSEQIGTASYKTFHSYNSAVGTIASLPLNSFPTVIKADGLALGKGVTIAQNKQDALVTIKDYMVGGIFGEAGKVIINEEFLKGQEISIHAFCDGKNFSLFPSSQDHKQIHDGDLGLNTGGMGTIAPVPWVTEALMNNIKENIVKKALEGLKNKGIEFKGILYPGIMITKDGPKVIEFNARFGDPETESYMRLLKTDLFDIFMACINGTLDKLKIEWENKYSCTVILASGGYPGSYEKGREISGLDSGGALASQNDIVSRHSEEQEDVESKDVVIFHCGTKFEDGKFYTNGGRVLAVSVVGDSLDQALEKAYDAIEKIHFEGMQFRKDIGKRKPFVV